MVARVRGRIAYKAMVRCLHEPNRAPQSVKERQTLISRQRPKLPDPVRPRPSVRVANIVPNYTTQPEATFPWASLLRLEESLCPVPFLECVREDFVSSLEC